MAILPKERFSSKPVYVSECALSRDQILKDFAIAFKSRLISQNIRREVLMGKAKFGIESSGKELTQIVLADYFKKGDFYSGYYRDQTFMMKKGLASTENLFASLYADHDNDPYSGGRQMNNHFATALIDANGQWLPQTDRYNVGSALAPLAGHVPRAMGIALASKKYKEQQVSNDFSHFGQEVSFCIVGDATTSEGIFFETVNAACVLQVPIIFVVQDDGYGISVPKKYQTTKESISKALKGFEADAQYKGLNISTAKAWDYIGLHKTFEKAVELCRNNHIPCLIHIEDCTQPLGHSTSGSHERYKSEERLQWEKDMDCLTIFEKWIISNGISSKEDLDEIKMDVSAAYKNEKKSAWNKYQEPFVNLKSEIAVQIKNLLGSDGQQKWYNDLLTKINELQFGTVSDLFKILDHATSEAITQDSDPFLKFKLWITSKKATYESQLATHLHSESNKAAIHISPIPARYDASSPIINGYEVLNAFFDQVLKSDPKIHAFGEDVGKIGDVNQAFAGLQDKYGETRIFDTGIREWSIVGQGIGMAMRGLRPIAEIQYLDYLAYAFPALTDELATLRYRSNGQQQAPIIVRTRGHRLEGIWHTGSPVGMLANAMRGIYILTPRNMTQAAGMYNTMLHSDDPAIMIECLNGYRKKEKLPSNLSEFKVALGVPEVLWEGTDITLVTYGACVSIAEEAVRLLDKKGISVELIDVQTILPFDLEHRILDSLKKTNKIIFLDEDVPGGATAYMMQEVLEVQGGYMYLDAPPKTITAKAHRTPFGDNGDYFCKPNVADVISAVDQLINQ